MAPRKTAAGPSLGPPLNTGSSTLTPRAEAGTSTGTSIVGNTGTSLATDSLPIVKVNNANLGEIKGALDDIVKNYFLSQSFTPSLLHPTVHLSLGYSSVVLALASVAYSLRVNFEESKSTLWTAVIGYSVLQLSLWAWKRWVERGEVFKGRRRRMVKRIETDHVQIISSTTLSSPPLPQLTFSPHTRPSSPGSASVPTSPISTSAAAFPPPATASSNASDGADKTTQSHATASSTPTSRTYNSPSIMTPTSSSASTASDGPSYLLQLNLSTTSNNGKSLIHKSRSVVGKTVGEFVDEQGGVEEGQVVRWLTAVLAEAGLVGAEDEGVAEVAEGFKDS